MRKKILVIEDDESTRDFVTYLLRLKSYATETAIDGLDALKKVHSFVPDLIITDIMMPQMDGYLFLEHIRNDPVTATIPVIFLSGRADRLDMRVGMELGADDYLTKPFNPDDLLAAVRTRLRRQDQVQGIPTPKESKRILYHAFLSYTRSDGQMMEQIKSLLSNEYLRIWTDEKLKPGTPVWTEAIETSIKYSGCFVVILSPEAKKSRWVNREIGYAELCGVQAFPLILKGEPEEVVPIALANCQWLDIRTSIEPEIKKLADAIKEHIGMNSSL